MSSAEEEKAAKQEALEGLVKAVQQRDVLFVLYHLKQLDVRSLNEEDPTTKLTPLEIALSLPSDCRRRALIVQLLLLAGAVASQAGVGVRGRAGDALPSSETGADGYRGADETARMLFHEITIEDAEVWLLDNMLDAVDEVPANCSHPPTLPSPPQSPEVSLACHASTSAIPAPPPNAPLRSVSPQPASPRANLPRVERSAATSRSPQSGATIHQGNRAAPPLVDTTAAITTTTFFVVDLAATTTSVDLKQLLVKSIDHTLIQKMETKTVSSKAAMKITLHRPVLTAAIQELNGAELDGSTIRTQIDPPAPPPPHDGTRYAFERPSPPPAARLYPKSPPLKRARKAQRNASPPRWNDGTKFSVARGYSQEMEAAMRSQPAPRHDASQAELDDWRDEAFNGRWPASYPGLPEALTERRNVKIPWRRFKCEFFPPRVGSKLCWGRPCDFAHDQAELRGSDNSPKFPALAAAFDKRKRTRSGSSDRPPRARSIDMQDSHQRPPPSSRRRSRSPFRLDSSPRSLRPYLPSQLSLSLPASFRDPPRSSPRRRSLDSDSLVGTVPPPRSSARDGERPKLSIVYGYVPPQVAQTALESGKRFSEDERRQLAYEHFLSSQTGEDREHYVGILMSLGSLSSETREFAEAARGALVIK